MAESSQKEKKTLWEKEKLLVTRNFSFPHSVFKRLVLQTRKNQGLFGKGLKNHDYKTLLNFEKPLITGCVDYDQISQNIVRVGFDI